MESSASIILEKLVGNFYKLLLISSRTRIPEALLYFELFFLRVRVTFVPPPLLVLAKSKFSDKEIPVLSRRFDFRFGVKFKSHAIKFLVLVCTI